MFLVLTECLEGLAATLPRVQQLSLRVDTEPHPNLLASVPLHTQQELSGVGVKLLKARLLLSENLKSRY